MRFAYAVPALALAIFVRDVSSRARRVVLRPGAFQIPPIASVTATSSDFRINEFLAGPARDWDGDGVLSTRDDEWVEFVNTGGATLDLSSFYFTDGDSIPRYAFTGRSRPAAGVWCSAAMPYDWEKATSHPAFGLSLGNTGDQVILWQRGRRREPGGRSLRLPGARRGRPTARSDAFRTAPACGRCSTASILTPARSVPPGHRMLADAGLGERLRFDRRSGA